MLGTKVVILEPGDAKTPIWQKGLEMLDQRISSFSTLFGDRADATLRANFLDAVQHGMEPVKIANAFDHALHVNHPKLR
ncbi:MAG TPA: hypothetical protein VKM55_10410 [Candidatus Lokiarchaeia archaeon]|nr:hypothetical protein [Candidatus Lokiarchaeia archaeon]